MVVWLLCLSGCCLCLAIVLVCVYRNKTRAIFLKAIWMMPGVALLLRCFVAFCGMDTNPAAAFVAEEEIGLLGLPAVERMKHYLNL